MLGIAWAESARQKASEAQVRSPALRVQIISKPRAPAAALAADARPARARAQRLYPGGAFDPMGLSKDAKAFEENKVKEVKNGRLAMVAWAGFFGQAASTGTSPLANLSTHLADPFHHSVAQNATALPWL